MKKKSILTLFFTITIIISIFFTCTTPNSFNTVKSNDISASNITPAELENFFDSIVMEKLNENNIPGAVISVVKDSKIVFAKGYGYANVEKQQFADPNTSLFRIASITKLFTWTAVMQLVEEGKIDLDKDINEYLDFQIPNAFPEPITMKDLMTHTAGFEYRWIGCGRNSFKKVPPLRDYLISDMTNRVYPTGKYIAYSNYGAGLAGYIIERVTNMSYEEYIQKNILDPLEMNHTTVYEPVPENLRPFLAKGYSFSKEPQNFQYEVMRPDGSMSATAVDMAKFMIAHLQNGNYNGKQILKEETAMQMHSTLFTHDPLLNGYTYGFQEQSIGGLRIIGHIGGWEKTFSRLSILPEENAGIFISVNGEAGEKTYGEIYDSFINHFFTQNVNSLTPPSDFNTRANKYTGIYLDRRRDFNHIEKLGWLINTIPVELTSNNTLLINEKEWIEVRPLLFRSSDENVYILFEENKKGNITGLYYYGGTDAMDLEKLSWYNYPAFQISLIVIFNFIFILYCIIQIINLVINFKRIKKEDKPTFTKQYQNLVLMTIMTSIASLVVFILIILAMLGNTDIFDYGLPFYLQIITKIPIILFILSIIIIVYTILIWKNKLFPIKDRWAKIFHILTLISLLGYFVWFYYWNIV
jgi:CubicO group peptidase (beta-lactamase class C family)